MSPTHDYVGKPVDGLIYVIVAERAKFDAIEVPERVGTNGCRSKMVGEMKRGSTAVIFQWWPDPTERAATAPSATPKTEPR